MVIAQPAPHDISDLTESRRLQHPAFWGCVLDGLSLDPEHHQSLVRSLMRRRPALIVVKSQRLASGREERLQSYPHLPSPSPDEISDSSVARLHITAVSSHNLSLSVF
jgi:hypothetical protein